MKWTPKQITHYRKLVDTSSSDSIRETAALCFDDCELFAPVPTTAVAAAENSLGCALPEELKQLYSQTDGVSAHYGAPLVMPLRRAVEENEALRRSPELRGLFMPFNHMLVFGGDNNGDLFFFPIHSNGSLASNVFIWDHESDSRSYFANTLKDFFLRYATNLI